MRRVGPGGREIVYTETEQARIKRAKVLRDAAPILMETVAELAARVVQLEADLEEARSKKKQPALRATAPVGDVQQVEAPDVLHKRGRQLRRLCAQLKAVNPALVAGRADAQSAHKNNEDPTAPVA
jgi:hypothetical protein